MLSSKLFHSKGSSKLTLSSKFNPRFFTTQFQPCSSNQIRRNPTSTRATATATATSTNLNPCNLNPSRFLTSKSFQFTRSFSAPTNRSDKEKIAASSSSSSTTTSNHLSSSSSKPIESSLWQRTKRWSRPYLALSRIDKPIGTWLLFWPCGEYQNRAQTSRVAREKDWSQER